MASDHLFAEYDLRGVLEAQKRRIHHEIEGIANDRLLNTTPESWVDYFQSAFQLVTPIIDEAGITVDQGEAKIDVSGDPSRLIFDRSRPFYLKGTEVVVFVPFTGEEDLFKCAPSTRTLNPPRGKVQGQELCLQYTRLDHDAEALKREIEQDLNQIRQYLEWIAREVAPFNGEIPPFVKQSIETRRGKLLKDQSLVGGLGFAMRRRADAPASYAVPTVRRKTAVARAPQGKAAAPPEPTLAMEEYQHILTVISNMVMVMERSPKAFKGMKEEDLRQHFLVQLNGHYEGQATGETFNFEGKTDILIRSEGRNIFIAECKFWDGPDSITKALDQLLGYTSWQDTKTAILVFNRQKNLSIVVEKVRGAVNAHPNLVRELPFSLETGHRVVLHHRNDKDRELLCTILVFDVPT